MAGHLLKIGIALFVAVISTWIARHFQVRTSIALLIGLVAGAGTLISEALDFFKKPFELWKLMLEIAKLRREAKEGEEAQQERNRRVKPATPEEIREYGVSYRERKLKIIVEVEKERERLAVKTFIAELHEKRK